MYPNIAPSLKIEETISHPIRSEEVIGFVGRNQKLGRTAVVMKEAALSEGFHGEVVSVPDDEAELFAEESELVVLLDETTLAMAGSDFETECRITTHKGRGQAVEMPDVRIANQKFREFSRAEVEVSN